MNLLKKIVSAIALCACLTLSGCGYAGTVVDKSQGQQDDTYYVRAGKYVWVPISDNSPKYTLVLQIDDGTYHDVNVNTNTFYSTEIGDYYDGTW